VLGSLAYKSPIVARSDPFQLACHGRGHGQLATHHLYLQARLEIVGANKLDAFNAMTSSLYSEVNVGIQDNNSPTVPEMALHLCLNLAAFYHRCARFPFISNTMVEWSILAVEEYEYLVKTKTVAQRGLLEFHVLPSFLKDRLQWKVNFTLLARRLTNAPGGPKPPLWFDMYALQMLFSQHEHSVFISPVYGCLIEKDQHDFQAFRHVPSWKRGQWFPGLRDFEAGEYPSSFTVVPILALDTGTFAQIIYTGRNENHRGLRKKLLEFNPESSGESVKLLRRQLRIVVIGGATEVAPGLLEGYCASKALCVHHGADTPTTSSNP
jgi:hypothetical protein